MRPLVIRFGALGDMILTTPLLRALAERHGEPCDVVGTGGFLEQLFRHLPFVGTTHRIISRKTPYWLCPEQWRLVRWLREQEHAALYVLQDDAKSLRLVERSGQAITASVLLTPPRAKEHIVDHYARMAGAAPGPTALRVTDDELAEVDAWLRTRLPDVAGHPLVLVQPGNRRTQRGKGGDERDRKHWPSEHWCAVIAGVLATTPTARVLVVGSPDEAWVTGPLAASAADARVISVAGELPLRRLFALLRRAHSLISVDTGPAHAAAALSCPVVVLFGQADPRRIRPYGSAPVRVVYGPLGAPEPDDYRAWATTHDISGITADAVLDAWNTLTIP